MRCFRFPLYKSWFYWVFCWNELKAKPVIFCGLKDLRENEDLIWRFRLNNNFQFIGALKIFQYFFVLWCTVGARSHLMVPVTFPSENQTRKYGLTLSHYRRLIKYYFASTLSYCFLVLFLLKFSEMRYVVLRGRNNLIQFEFNWISASVMILKERIFYLILFYCLLYSWLELYILS